MRTRAKLYSICHGHIICYMTSTNPALNSFWQMLLFSEGFVLFGCCFVFVIDACYWLLTVTWASIGSEVVTIVTSARVRAFHVVACMITVSVSDSTFVMICKRHTLNTITNVDLWVYVRIMLFRITVVELGVEQQKGDNLLLSEFGLLSTSDWVWGPNSTP